MRRAAEELGVGTASLYTYLPGKAEPAALMADSVAAEDPLPDAGPATGGPRWRREPAPTTRASAGARGCCTWSPPGSRRGRTCCGGWTRRCGCWTAPARPGRRAWRWSSRSTRTCAARRG
ncbi:hypothetical protein [Saccharothrix sp. HUAS TT1]|uniref:hypothetical protein n=1 Tax=Saccharothrix sp. HUAS TT1 TaxID=3231910 RepID=UPI00345BD945